MRAPWLAAAFALSLLASAGAGPGAAPSAKAQDDSDAPDPVWRFQVGERAEYSVTFGRLRVGRSVLEVEAVDTIGGEPAYRLAWSLRGGPFFYKIDDRQVSWLATNPLRSLRFQQILNEGRYHRNRRYEMDHDAGAYRILDFDHAVGEYRPGPESEPLPMSPLALDEVSYVFFTRLIPLELGQRYEFDRYFSPDGNPLVLEVLRREKVRVPAGTFQTIVVRPTIRTSGVFGEEGEAELYLSDDERRVVVQLKTKMKAGVTSMYLTKYDPGG